MKAVQKSDLKNKRWMLLFAGAGLLLSIPLIAMQFSTEVNWTTSDFGIMGILLFGTALVIELIFRNVRNLKNRIVFCAIALFIFLLVWAEMAVGIFGTPIAGN